MPLDVTPGEVVVKARDAIRDKYASDYKLRVPAAEVGPGTQPYVDGSVVADALLPVYNDAQVIGRGTNLRTSAGKWLNELGAADAVTKRPAVGASGFVTVSASIGGGTILAGTQLKEKQSGLAFQVTATAVYLDQQQVPITGTDTGPATNFPAGTILQFTNPPPGIGPTAVVFAQSDGSGLTDGRAEDDDQTYRQLISAKRANPPASGNDAEYQRRIERTPGLSVQKAFTYPAILGPGTSAFVFTLNPARPGGGRTPNPAQIATALSNLLGLEPADDSIFAATLSQSPTTAVLTAAWRRGAAGWSDATPWPAYIAGDKVLVTNGITPTPTQFQLSTGTATTTPQIGQTIAFYDASVGVFRRKRILTVTVITPGKTWNIRVDTSNNVSDTGFTPAVGAATSPYAGSLDLVAAAVISYFDTLGPGEQVAAFPDPGLRQRRQPESPVVWPSVIGNRLIGPVLAVSAVSDATLLEPTIPYKTPVGTPGVLSYLITLGDLAVFPQ